MAVPMTTKDEEAKRRYDNAENDSTRIYKLKMEIALILTYACTQACAQRGVHLNERKTEELQQFLEHCV